MVFTRILTEEERFFSLVTKNDGGCWMRPAEKAQGYSTFRTQVGRRQVAHRWAYEHFVGPIPPGFELDHLCHTRDANCPGGKTCPHRACCNPAHLEPVTKEENNRRSSSPSALNAQKTHCPQDHPYDQFQGGERRCGTCRREQWRLRHPKAGLFMTPDEARELAGEVRS